MRRHAILPLISILGDHGNDGRTRILAPRGWLDLHGARELGDDRWLILSRGQGGTGVHPLTLGHSDFITLRDLMIVPIRLPGDDPHNPGIFQPLQLDDAVDL